VELAGFVAGDFPALDEDACAVELPDLPCAVLL